MERIWNQIYLHDNISGKTAHIQINDWNKERIEHFVCIINDFMKQLEITNLKAGYRVAPLIAQEERRKPIRYGFDYVQYRFNLNNPPATLLDFIEKNECCMGCKRHSIVNCYECLEKGIVEKLT